MSTHKMHEGFDLQLEDFDRAAHYETATIALVSLASLTALLVLWL
ncbi:MAG: hypothetical protein AAGI92_00705 [Pseudomonadota bacterium]